MTSGRPARAGFSIDQWTNEKPAGSRIRAGFLLEVCIKFDAVLFWAGVWIHRL